MDRRNSDSSLCSETPSFLVFEKVLADAIPPIRSSTNAAGFDLHSADGYQINPTARMMIRTGLRLQMPPGTYGRIAPRSGLAVNLGIHVGAGVIDADYRGEVFILLFNHGHQLVTINPGDRVAQLICEKIETPIVVEASSECYMTETLRGVQGFGSTGE